MSVLTGNDFLTIAGTTAITLALANLLKTIWPQSPEPWATWAIAELTVFTGALVLKEAWTTTTVTLWFFSGMVVAAAALGSHTGLTMIMNLESKGPPPST